MVNHVQHSSNAERSLNVNDTNVTRPQARLDNLQINAEARAIQPRVQSQESLRRPAQNESPLASPRKRRFLGVDAPPSCKVFRGHPLSLEGFIRYPGDSQAGLLLSEHAFSLLQKNRTSSMNDHEIYATALSAIQQSKAEFSFESPQMVSLARQLGDISDNDTLDTETRTDLYRQLVEQHVDPEACQRYLLEKSPFLSFSLNASVAAGYAYRSKDAGVFEAQVNPQDLIIAKGTPMVGADT
jgi:hypothetical protein